MTQGTRVLLGTAPNNHLTTVCLSFPSASFCTRRLRVNGTAVSQTAGLPSPGNPGLGRGNSEHPWQGPQTPC